MKNNRLKTLAVVMTFFVLSGCGTASSAGENAVDNEVTFEAASAADSSDVNAETQDDVQRDDASVSASQQIIIEYPDDMQTMGFTDPVVLERMPERVAVLSTPPVLTLHELGVNMIAIPSSQAATWPEELKDIPELNVLRNENFDIETVVVMDPDLVILGTSAVDTYGKVLTDLNIPVYYVNAGHMVSYESIKSQTEALVNAFGRDTEAGQALLARFTELEDHLKETSEILAGKTCMTLMSAPPSHYIQDKDGTLGSMADMIGLTNVFDTDQPGMIPLDFETAINYDPDVIIVVGAQETSEELQQIMEEEFAGNSAFWYSIPAVERGDVIYLPVKYITASGITLTDDISELADELVEFFAE